MKQAARAVIAIALGAGLAAAAQAQSTNPQPNPALGTQVQSTAPSNVIPSTTPAKDTQSMAPQTKQRHAKAQMHTKSQMKIRQVQLRLKSEGLLNGKVTGKMDRPTHIALAREQQNGLGRSGSSMQHMRTAHLGKKQQEIGTAHVMRHPAKSQTTGVGSSMPNTKNANAPQTTPAPAGAGGTTTPSTAPATSTPPSTSPANK